MTGERPWSGDEAVRIIGEHKAQEGAVLPILHALQDYFGYVDRGAIPLIAEALNLSKAEIHGVVSFYHDFRHAPPGRNVIKVCRAESCQAAGGVALADHIKRRLGIDFGETTHDRAFTLEAVYCLGNCACSPAAVIDDELIGRLSPARFDATIAHLSRAGR